MMVTCEGMGRRCVEEGVGTDMFERIFGKVFGRFAAAQTLWRLKQTSVQAMEDTTRGWEESKKRKTKINDAMAIEEERGAACCYADGTPPPHPAPRQR